MRIQEEIEEKLEDIQRDIDYCRENHLLHTLDYKLAQQRMIYWILGIEE